MSEAVPYCLSRYLSSPTCGTPAASPDLGKPLRSHSPPFQWDLPSTCTPFFPVLRYVSRILAERGLYLALIISHHGNICLPAWPVSKSAQATFIRIARKAYCRFPLIPPWMRSLAKSSTVRDSSARLEAMASDDYLIRRSIVQHELIFSSESLTLLSADHIYTFKKLLTEPRKDHELIYTDFAPHVHLLHRINQIYTGRKPTLAYLRRAHDIDLDERALAHVCRLYQSIFNQPGVQAYDPNSDKRLPSLPEDTSPSIGEVRSDVYELESPIVGQSPDQVYELESPKFLEHQSHVVELGTESISIQLPEFLQQIESSSFTDQAYQERLPENDNTTVAYPKVPRLHDFSKAPPPLPPRLVIPSSPTDIVRTICSRCLAEVENPKSLHNSQDMTMVLSPEWESFREIGLGLLKV